MDSIIDSFFNSFSDKVDQNRMELRRNLERSYDSALIFSNALGKKHHPPVRYQNPFVHTRISFPQISSIGSFLKDLFSVTNLGSENNFIYDDCGFFLSTKNFGGSEESNLIIEGRSGRDGTIDTLLYFSKENQIIHSFPIKDNSDSFDVVFQFNGRLMRMDFTRTSENSFSSRDLVILTSDGSIDTHSDLVFSGNI